MKKAFTLIELLVVSAIIILLGIVVVSTVKGCASSSSTSAEDQMREYLRVLYPGREIIGIACTARDTDLDGYVSCTATVDMDPGPAVQEKQIEAECSRQFMSFNEGCRPIKYRPSNQ